MILTVIASDASRLSLRAKRSNLSNRDESVDCFVAKARRDSRSKAKNRHYDKRDDVLDSISSGKAIAVDISYNNRFNGDIFNTAIQEC